HLCTPVSVTRSAPLHTHTLSLHDALPISVPDGTVAEIRPAPEAGSTARVSFESPSAPEDRRLTAFVDPCTGEVTGVLPTFGDSKDRKSTRLNSSHVSISYAVFCLKKKKHE